MSDRDHLVCTSLEEEGLVDWNHVKCFLKELRAWTELWKVGGELAVAVAVVIITVIAVCLSTGLVIYMLSHSSPHLYEFSSSPVLYLIKRSWCDSCATQWGNDRTGVSIWSTLLPLFCLTWTLENLALFSFWQKVKCANFLNQEFILQKDKWTKMLVASLFVLIRDWENSKVHQRRIASTILYCNPYDRILIYFFKKEVSSIEVTGNCPQCVLRPKKQVAEQYVSSL